MKTPDMPRDGVPVEKTVRDIINFIRASQITNVVGGLLKTNSGGTTIEFRPGKGGATAAAGIVGAFYTTYNDTLGDTFLQAGTVTGGNGGSAAIVDEKVLDVTTGVGTNSGKYLYIQASCTATVTDGIMLPGCLLNSASLVTGASVPANHTFTVASATGNLYVEIGRWNDETFLKAGPPGNRLASGCLGNFSLTPVA